MVVERSEIIGHLIETPECLFTGWVLWGSQEPVLDALVIDIARENLERAITNIEASEFRYPSQRLCEITDGMLWSGLRILEGLGVANELDNNCWLLTAEGRDIMEEVRPLGAPEDAK